MNRPRNRGGNRQNNFYFKHRLKITSKELDLLILPGKYRLFQGDPNDTSIFYEVPRHTVKRGDNYYRSFSCSKDSGNGECVGCHQMDQRDEGVTKRLVYYFSVVHLDWYYKVPATDRKTGQIIMTRGDNPRPIYNLETPSNPKEARLWEKEYDRVFGKKLYLEVGKGHFSNIVDMAAEADKLCSCGGNLDVVSYVCPHCGHVHMTMDDMELSEDELREALGSEMMCPSCKEVDFMEPSFACDSCDEPDPVKITDVVLRIKKIGEKTQSNLLCLNATRTSDYIVPSNDLPLIVDGVMNPDLTDRYLHEPMNFEEMFSGDMELDRQAELCKVDNPFGGVTYERQ